MSKNFEHTLKKYKNGIAKITCQNAEVSVCAPFATVNDELVCGTGFHIPAKHLYMPERTPDGTKAYYFCTNAHVIDGCASKRVELTFPTHGTTSFYGTVVTACHALDFAIVRLTNEYNNFLEQQLGRSFNEIMEEIPALKPNSKVLNTTKQTYQSVAAYGYPLDSADCHISSGKISGRHEFYLQLNSSISSGNSGGPVFNTQGEVVGMMAASFDDSEGIALGIPWSSISKMLLEYRTQDEFVLHTPNLGLAVQNLIYSYSTVKLKDSSLRGALVKNVFKKSPLHNLVKKNDVVLKIGDCNNEYEIDSKCLVKVTSQHDKIHFCSLNFVMLLDRNTTYLDIWRKGKTKRINFALSNDVGKVEEIMPSIEEQDCLIFCGMTMTNLTANHLTSVEDESDPAIVGFLSSSHMAQHAVVISGFQHPCSVLQQGYDHQLKSMTIITKVNNVEVVTVDDVRKALNKAIPKYLNNMSDDSKYRFVTLLAHNKEEYIVDLKLGFQLENLLNATPGFPAELSVIEDFLEDFNQEVALSQNNKKASKKRKR